MTYFGRMQEITHARGSCSFQKDGMNHGLDGREAEKNNDVAEDATPNLMHGQATTNWGRFGREGINGE